MTVDAERAYVLEQFEQTAQSNRNRRIAIYGTGVNTEYILNNSQIAGECVVGLMNGDDCSGTMYGLPVITHDMACTMADVIVVVAQFRSLPIIYERLKDLEQEHTLIIDLAQRRLSDLFDIKAERKIADAYDIGYEWYGPLLLEYTKSLIHLTKDSYDKVLFFARDGYILTQIYEMLVHALRLNKYAQGLYVEASRRALAVAGIRNRQDLVEQINRVPEKMPAGKLLQVRFGVEPHVDDLRKTAILEKGDLNEYVLSYEREILEEAQEERECYLSYLKSIGIQSNDKNVIFDGCTSGTCGYFYRKLTGTETSVYAIQLLDLTDFSLIDVSLDRSFFDIDTNFLKKNAFNRMGVFNDAVLTAPNTQLVRIGVDGKPNYSEAESNRNLHIMQRVHEGILQYCGDYIENNRNGMHEEVDKKLLDDKLAELADGKVRLVPELLAELYTVEEFSGQSGKVIGLS